VRLWFSTLFIIMPFSLMAQLTAPGSVSARNVTYPSVPGRKDKAFFYCNVLGTERGTLAASRPNQSGTRNYTWYKWNDLTTSFSTFIRTDAGVTSSSINNLTEGGYKVDIDNAGIYDTTLAGWIFFDKPPLAVAALAQQLCYRVALSGTATATIDKFYYKDINTGASLSLNNEVSHVWRSDPSSFIPAPDVYLNPKIENYPSEPPFIQYNLPLVDVIYKLTVSTLGCSSSSSFLYHSIHVKADFEADPVDGEAPLVVSFTNKSIRDSINTWEFGDKTPPSTLETPDPHTYYVPGKYSVTLIIESSRHCVDSLRMDSLINVTPSVIEIPNVFTPNDDGFNDRFMVNGKSLRFVSMEIFSQSGLKVYGFSGEGEILKNWTGWDGNINNSSIKASIGVYYYVIRALGWDDISYNGKKYRGFVYLYR
jgi:gliding motility-associated-like protein